MTTREQIIAEVDRVAGELDAAGALDANARGTLTRTHGTRFFRKPPVGQPSDEPTDAALRVLLGSLRVAHRRAQR